MPTKPNWWILLIDDDEDDYFLVKQMLNEARGMKVELEWASTFQKGREAISHNTYDAILVDYDLGPETGLEIIRQSCQAKYPAPFILLTGRGSYEVDLEAMHAGATIYLTKAEVNSLLLERSIRYAIEHKQIQTDLETANQYLLKQQKDLEEQNLRLRQEIVERKKVEDALRSQEVTLRAILDATTESIWLFRTDGTILLGNEIAISRMKLPASEVIGKDFRNLMPQELAEARGLKLREVIETGQRLEFEDERAGMLFHHTFYPVIDGDGKPVAVAAFSRDITNQKRGELALRASEERFRRILQNSVDMIYSLNMQTMVYEYVSPSSEQVIGYSPVEVMAMTPAEGLAHIHPDDLDEVRHRLATANEVDMIEYEYRFRCKDGQYRWLSAHLNVQKDEAGQPLWRSAVVRRIPDRD